MRIFSFFIAAVFLLTEEEASNLFCTKICSLNLTKEHIWKCVLFLSAWWPSSTLGGHLHPAKIAGGYIIRKQLFPNYQWPSLTGPDWKILHFKSSSCAVQALVWNMLMRKYLRKSEGLKFYLRNIWVQVGANWESAQVAFVGGIRSFFAGSCFYSSFYSHGTEYKFCHWLWGERDEVSHCEGEARSFLSQCKDWHI